jgi:uncharacterized SAM-dependent methyltransferase
MGRTSITLVSRSSEKCVQGLLADYQRRLPQMSEKKERNNFNLPGRRMGHSKTDRCLVLLTEVREIPF